MDSRIDKSYHFDAAPSAVWDSLVKPEAIVAWGGGPVRMRAEKGFKFSLWGGDIHGVNREVVTNKLLIQDWYSGDWKAPSIVTFRLKPSEGGTLLELEQEQVPKNEIDDVGAGWDNYYFEPMKNYLKKL